MSIKEIGKRSLLYLLAVVILICILFPLFHTSSNQQALKRLDEISERLSSIDRQLEKIDGEIIERQIKKDNLITEQTALNEEAQQLFLNLVTPEMIKVKAESLDDSDICPVKLFEKYERDCVNHLDEICDGIGCDPNDDWQPGQLTADGLSQQMPEIEGDTSHERFKQLAYKYGLDPSLIWEVENKYGIVESTILCVMIAETSGGKKGYGTGTCNNVGNVYNTDSGNRKCFDSYKEGLEAIGQTLNNRYLGTIATLGCLSNGGSCKNWDNNSHRYATSNGNWERNMVACLSTVYGEEIDPATFIFRK